MSARRRTNNRRANPNAASSGATSTKTAGTAKRAASRRRKTSNAKSAKAFWGDPAKLPEPPEQVRITSDPSAVLRSLGRPRLSGQEHLAEIYFRAVSERAVVLASALAAAGDLVEPDALIDD